MSRKPTRTVRQRRRCICAARASPSIFLTISSNVGMHGASKKLRRRCFPVTSLCRLIWPPSDGCQLNSTFGVTRLVRHDDRPAAVPQHVIDALKHREDAGGFVQLDRRPRFSPGDKIRVVGGAFCDSVGLYEGLSSRERVAILLELLGRKVRIVLDSETIEAA